jgi:hypothetical protein
MKNKKQKNNKKMPQEKNKQKAKDENEWRNCSLSMQQGKKETEVEFMSSNRLATEGDCFPRGQI